MSICEERGNLACESEHIWVKLAAKMLEELEFLDDLWKV